MRNRKTTSNSSNQMRWVILLLALAVILPTVCLLYFMTQAVKNERLAVRQKLVDIYTEQTDRVIRSINSIPDIVVEGIQKKFETYKPGHLRLYRKPRVPKHSVLSYDSMSAWIVYGADGKILTPKTSRIEILPEMPVLENANSLEYQDKDYNKAIDAYRQVLSDHKQDSLVKGAALMGIGRCKLSQEKPREAIKAFNDASSMFKRTLTIQKLNWSAMAKFRAGQIGISEYEVGTKEHTEAAIDMLPFEEGTISLNVFLYNKAFTLIDPHIETLKGDIAFLTNYEYAKELSYYYNLPFKLLERYPDVNALQHFKPGTYQRADIEEQYYCQLFKSKDKYGLAIYEPEEITRYFREKIKGLDKPGEIYYSLSDDSGDVILGKRAENSKPFMTFNLAPYFDGWKLELFFYDASVFDKAASEQAKLYIWTSVLVSMFILCFGIFAGLAIERQIRTNRLKNDFIATVTHELKTPLASMRVLVDTLLEGSYNDQKQAVEYLGLISKENKRLTGLIDNFLTFSRMERNKQAFEMVECPAGDIVNDAAAAVRTKFDQKSCRFSVTIGEDVASVYADKDAMVTVLINLLDNAYKYSGDEKEIELSVYNENGSVCFAVTDNGIGMPVRVQKKVFERFYQADSKLSRTAEGCGLGLSIVKFILDAHNATIEVQSTAGKGSVFIVKIHCI